MSGECGLPGQKSSGDREGRNSLLLPLLVAGAYDPSSIWFQYFLCKDQQIYCYFFTQGWNQYEYGQYYLYENLLDDQNAIFAGSSDSSNLATLALLGGLGGGSPHSGYYPSPSGYSQVSAGRKRRGSDEQCTEGTDCHADRKRREVCLQDPKAEGCPVERKRREVCHENPTADGCPGDRKRREVCLQDPKAEGCPDDRKRRDACDACKLNSDSTDCKDCPEHM